MKQHSSHLSNKGEKCFLINFVSMSVMVKCLHGMFAEVEGHKTTFFSLDITLRYLSNTHQHYKYQVLLPRMGTMASCESSCGCGLPQASKELKGKILSSFIYACIESFAMQSDFNKCILQCFH